MVETLVFGMGNQGREFIGTKHNIGMDYINSFISKNRLETKETTFFNYAKLNNLVLTYSNSRNINESGYVLDKIFSKFRHIDTCVLIFDDINLESNVLKFNPKLKKTSHNAIRWMSKFIDISKYNFYSLRIGVGRNISMDLDQDVFIKFTLDQNKEKKIDGAMNFIATNHVDIIKDLGNILK